MELKFILESILFSAQQPMTPKELRDLLASAAEQSEESEVRAVKKTSVDEIIAALEQLVADHEQAGRSYRLACVAGAWQFASQPEYAPWIKALVGVKSRPPRLSQPALETLAIIAYRQPLTRAEMEQVRGVAVDGVIATLLERGLIEQVGRAEVIGRPMTYGTTPYFLEYFGLRGLEDLPAADELRRVPVQKPEALLTVENGLATPVPEALKTEEASAEGGGSTEPPKGGTRTAQTESQAVAGGESTEPPEGGTRTASEGAETAQPSEPEGVPRNSESGPAA